MSKYDIAIEELGDIGLELTLRVISLDIKRNNEEDEQKRLQLDRAIYCINWITDFVRERIDDEKWRKTCEDLGYDWREENMQTR